MSPSEHQQQPKDEQGQPADLSASTPAVRAIERAVDKLETARVFIERDLERGRQDFREVRDQAHRDMLDVGGRLKALETKVADLPSKVWIGTCLIGAIAAISGIVAIIAKATGH